MVFSIWARIAVSRNGRSSSSKERTVLGFPLVDQGLLRIECSEQTQALIDGGGEVPCALGRQTIEHVSIDRHRLLDGRVVRGHGHHPTISGIACPGGCLRWPPAARGCRLQLYGGWSSP